MKDIISNIIFKMPAYFTNIFVVFSIIRVNFLFLKDVKTQTKNANTSHKLNLSMPDIKLELHSIDSLLILGTSV